MLAVCLNSFNHQTMEEKILPVCAANGLLPGKPLAGTSAVRSMRVMICRSFLMRDAMSKTNILRVDH
jgi:hypothetical protein